MPGCSKLIAGLEKMHSELIITGIVLLACILSANGDTIWGNSELDFTRFHQSPAVAVHLSLAGQSSVVASWLNVGEFKPEAQPPICAYGRTADSFTAITAGEAYTYTAGDFDSTLNRVTMDLQRIGFKHGEEVYYRCCNPDLGGWSSLYSFTVRQGGLEDTEQRWVPPSLPGPRRKIALVADLGIQFGQNTVDSISRHVQSGEVQLVVHAGDISYADDFSRVQHNNSFVWTEYMAMIEPFAARVPYMVGPGNHEAQYNFAAYRNWFHMPHNDSQSESPFYYSFDYMGVHFVSMSTEHDFSPGSTQHQWLGNDLRKADANRKNVPWIFVHGHRPLYCSGVTAWITRCTVTGQAPRYRANMEGLFHKYKVDVYMAGHNHQYERSYPVYNMTVTSKSYHNPKGTVYIVNGAAGNPELNDPTFVPESMVPWRAKMAFTENNGWMLMEVNATSLDFTYLFSKNDEVFDRFTITKDSV